jgi:AcrR family transcriptional regulator
MATKSADTRAAILARAVDIASTEGLEGLTIGRLAAELQMSKSGLFAHFGSKQELQLATVHEAARRFFDAVVAPAQATPEGAGRLRDYCLRYVEYLGSDVYEGGCFWSAVTGEVDDRPGPVRDAVRDLLATWLAELARNAALAGAREPEQLVFEIYALVSGANACLRLLGEPDALRRARAAIERRLPA